MSKDIKAKDLSYKAAQSVVEHGSIPLATLKEAISMQEKMDELLAKEIEFPEQEPFPEIPSFPERFQLATFQTYRRLKLLTHQTSQDYRRQSKALKCRNMES